VQAMTPSPFLPLIAMPFSGIHPLFTPAFRGRFRLLPFLKLEISPTFSPASGGCRYEPFPLLSPEVSSPNYPVPTAASSF